MRAERSGWFDTGSIGLSASRIDEEVQRRRKGRHQLTLEKRPPASQEMQ
jgi:hypothetical protein